jgi:hypothetical protein
MSKINAAGTRPALNKELLTCWRVSNVENIIFGDKPTVCALLPFSGNFPIVKSIYSTGFINSTRMSYKFEDLVDSLKSVVQKAEKYKYYDDLFIEYLKNKSISAENFKQFAPEIKKRTIQEWMNHDRIPDGILEE